MKRKVAIIMSALMVFAMSVPSFAVDQYNDEDPNTITSVEELEEVIDELNDDGSISKKEQKELIENTEPEVVEEYMEDVLEAADDVIEEANLNIDKCLEGDGYYSETFEIDENTSVTLEFEDKEEENIVDEALSSLYCYAASNGETMWKAYGNRYFTAKKTVQCGIGYATMIMENHYNLSKSGITERYGITGISGMSLLGSSSAGSAHIGTSTAKSKGNSVNMYATYNIRVGVKGVASYYSTRKLTTAVKYVDKNTKSKQIKVKHSWS